MVLHKQSSQKVDKYTVGSTGENYLAFFNASRFFEFMALAVDFASSAHYATIDFSFKLLQISTNLPEIWHEYENCLKLCIYEELVETFDCQRLAKEKSKLYETISLCNIGPHIGALFSLQILPKSDYGI